MKLELVTPQIIFRDHMRKEKDTFGILGMGIGKTAAVLSHLSELFLDAEAFGALVIAPLRVLNLTWPSEIAQWDQLRWMRFANLRTESGKRDFLNGNAHIYGINYESIPILVELVKARRGKLPYDVAVYDESTKAKNPGSKRIRLYRTLPRVERNIALTGTPMPNSHRDLFAQVRLVDGGKRLGTNYRQFLDSYFTTTNYGGFPQYKEKAGAGESIEQKIADITVTLKSSDWLNIPDTVIEDVEILFPKELRDKYKTLEDQLIIELRKDKTINVGSAAALVTKLQQFTSGEMYDDERHHHPIHDLKFEALGKLVKAEKGEPVLVACMFKHEYARMKERFPQSVFFNDAKTIPAQTQLMKDWNSKKIPILFAHPASIGHGLNLQFGSSVLIFISGTYNREWYDQFIARVARRGQKNVTRVYRLMVPGTVDDAVASALESKAANEARLLSALAMLEKLRNAK